MYFRKKVFCILVFIFICLNVIYVKIDNSKSEFQRDKINKIYLTEFSEDTFYCPVCYNNCINKQYKKENNIEYFEKSCRTCQKSWKVLFDEAKYF
jgi:hypothetical protein